jgi:sterol desaturase/sphingolipid hydroxylase (fatty acid hydroxylase superfamily)
VTAGQIGQPEAWKCPALYTDGVSLLLSYPVALLLVSALVAGLEAVRPWRPHQRQLRRRLLSDAAYLAFNGHFLGLALYAVATSYLLPPLDRLLDRAGLAQWLYRNAAAGWPLWLQIPVVLVGLDFIQWCVHNLLHRVAWLWEFHKMHHSVVDGEMDWIVSFRFHWMEVVVYKAAQYLPLAFFGFHGVALFVHAVVGTLIGHLNHANLDLGHGRWRYVLNSPRMHIWHHDYDAPPRQARNFAIIFSAWDWLFGTAHLPDRPPRRLGFPEVETAPSHFLTQTAWPLQRWLGRIAPVRVDGPLAGGLGLALVLLGLGVAYLR